MKNKTILRATAMTIFAIVLILSCSKQQMTTEDFALNYELPNDIAKHVIQQNGLLKFENKESFDLVFQILESENKRHNDLLQEYCVEMTSQSLEYKEISKANEFAVYEAFEESLGFKSLRARIAMDEAVWLNNRELDLANDPDNHCIVGSEMRTLFNENGEIMIGNSIYVVGENWLVYEITNGSFQILESLRETGLNEQKSQHLTIHNQESNLKADDCKLNQDKVYYNNYAIDYRVKCRVTITNAVFWHYAKAETTHYIYDGQGGWDKEPADLEVHVSGLIRNSDCGITTTPFNNSDAKSNVKSISVKQSFGTTVKAQNGEVFSVHYVNDTSVFNVVLDW